MKGVIKNRQKIGERMFHLLFLLFVLTSAKAQVVDMNERLTGAWALDSVQVREIMAGETVQETVPSDGQAKFNQKWMPRFKLDGNGKASYSRNQGKASDKSYHVRNVPYKIKNINGNSATLIINGVPDYKILSIELLSDGVMQINISFRTSWKLQDIEVNWCMFYHKPDSSN